MRNENIISGGWWLCGVFELLERECAGRAGEEAKNRVPGVGEETLIKSRV